jgi:simple sugar transport system permease protein
MTATLMNTARQFVKGKGFKRLLVFGLSALFVLSVVEVITGTEELTRRGTSGAALRLAIPIMLAGLGGLYSERAGIVNIGLEGMMIMGTWFGAWGAFFEPLSDILPFNIPGGPAWEGALLGLIGGAIGGLIHAIATVTFNVDHIVSGVAINILALGGMRFLAAIAYEDVQGGGATQSPGIQTMSNFNIPFLSGGQLFGWKTPDFLGWLEDQDWFFLSDTGGILRGLLGDLSWLVLVGIVLVPISVFLLWRTPWGLQLRSCGENPWAAESLGVPVLRMKYYAVIISGALAGLGGAFLPLVQSGLYREGQTGGRGFIGLASLIFGNWKPTGVLAGSALFGLGDSLRFRGAEAVRALFLAIAIGLFFYAAYTWFRKQEVRGTVIQAVAGAAFLFGYFQLEEVPTQLIGVTPYVITLLVLTVATQRLRMPAADGARYRKGEAV